MVIFLNNTRCVLFLHIHHLLLIAPPGCSHSSPVPHTNQHSVRPLCHVHSFPGGRLSCYSWFSVLQHRFGGFALLLTPAAELNMISFAIRALLQYVTAEWFLLCCTPHYIAFVIPCLVITWPVATLRLAAAVVLDMAPTAAEFTLAVRALVCESVNSVPHSHRLNTFLD